MRTQRSQNGHQTLSKESEPQAYGDTHEDNTKTSEDQ